MPENKWNMMGWLLELQQQGSDGSNLNIYFGDEREANADRREQARYEHQIPRSQLLWGFTRQVWKRCASKKMVTVIKSGGDPIISLLKIFIIF